MLDMGQRREFDQTLSVCESLAHEIKLLGSVTCYLEFLFMYQVCNINLAIG